MKITKLIAMVAEFRWRQLTEPEICLQAIGLFVSKRPSELLPLQFPFANDLSSSISGEGPFLKLCYINVLLHATSSGLVHCTSSFNKQSLLTLSGSSISDSFVSQLL